MSSSSRMCEATPFAKAATGADARPPSPPRGFGATRPANTVASFDVPKRSAICRASRAGFSIEPPSAEPSQSVTDRCACSMTSRGRSSYLVEASTSASARVVRRCDGPLASLSDTEVLQPLHDDREIHGHVDDAQDEAEHPEVSPLDVAAAVIDRVLSRGARTSHADHAERRREPTDL